MTEQLPEEVLESLERLSGVLLSEESLDAVMNLVVKQADATIPAADAVSVFIVSDSNVRTAAYSADLAKDADDIQLSEDDGPCIDAIRTGAINRIPSMREEARWPAYVPGATARGIASSLSLPLSVGGDSHGALNLYSRSEGAFADGAGDLAVTFAAQASILLANAFGHMSKDHAADQLKQALKSQETIGKAIGILMEHDGIGEEEASEIMRSRQEKG